MSLKLSREGLKRLERELELLKGELATKRLYTNQIASESGTSYNDNHDFEQAAMDERILINSIHFLKEQISTAIIIDEEIQKDTVNYGAKVDLILICKGNEENMTILFSDSEEKSEFENISLNSPMGKAIYKQKVGFEGTYTVDNTSFTVKILKIEY